MWELDHKEVWVQRIDAFELWYWELPWTARRSNQSILKEINWIFIGRTDAEAPILRPPDAKSWVTGKDPDPGKDWGQEEKETIEDEMVGWHYWHNGHEFEQTAGDNERQGNLECCSPWGQTELNRTERLNRNNITLYTLIAYSFYVVYSLWPHW